MILVLAFIIAMICAVCLVWYMKNHIDISIDNKRIITHDSNKSERSKDR